MVNDREEDYITNIIKNYKIIFSGTSMISYCKTQLCRYTIAADSTSASDANESQSNAVHSTTSEATTASIAVSTESSVTEVTPFQLLSTTIANRRADVDDEDDDDADEDEDDDAKDDEENTDDEENENVNRIDDKVHVEKTPPTPTESTDDDDNTHSNDLIYETNESAPVQRTECATGEGSCDHGCRMIYANVSDTIGRTECFCSVGFRLDSADGRTCHGI